MIGAFHQPVAVVSDSLTLKTLPDRQLKAGLAEVIKYGLIRDAEFFQWLEKNMQQLVHRDSEALAYAIYQSCQNKAEVVAEDEKEQGQRALLNLGHTFGHAVETGLGYKDWLHGEAVGLGMLMAAELSCRLDWITREQVNRIRNLLENAGLPLQLPQQIKDADIREFMSVDKKARDGNLYLVLLKDIGSALLTGDFPEDTLAQTIDSFRL